MGNILLITSSPRGEASYSTQVATDLATQLGGDLTVRELWRNPPPAIGPEFVQAIFTPEADRSLEQASLLRDSDEAVAEIQAADTVIVAAAMINFGLPAPLKTWIDLTTRSGLTFRYGAAGPEGLLKGKRLILVLASGGVYSTGPAAEMNHLEPTLRSNLGFLGLTDVEVIRIEGLAMGPDSVESALSAARDRTTELVTTHV